MEIKNINFNKKTVKYLFDAPLEALSDLAPANNSVIITDNIIWKHYAQIYPNYEIQMIPSGEIHKTPQTINILTEILLELKINRSSTLIAMGGGVVTDLVGYLASTFMRGVRFGFIPTTLLAMVDAAIGGKNGVNLGLHKNILGTISAPDFILFNYDFLKTLPEIEINNGMAEIIKYGCIKDETILNSLENNSKSIVSIIENCVSLKNEIVFNDEFENEQRKILNFGHTVGHALEMLYHLKHGAAIGLGMLIACKIGENSNHLDSNCFLRIEKLLLKNNLPTTLKNIDIEAVMQLIFNDKKARQNEIDFVLLDKIGVAKIQKLTFETIKNGIIQFNKTHGN